MAEANKILVAFCPRCCEVTDFCDQRHLTYDHIGDLVTDALHRGDEVLFWPRPVKIGGGCKCKKEQRCPKPKKRGEAAR